MSVITAYKCDTTGKLFEDKDKYKKHIRKIATARRNQLKIDQAHKVEVQWWHDNFWNHVKSLDQLKAAILYHRDVFAARGVKNYWSDKKLKPTPIVEFTTFRLGYSDCVSNTHDCPHNGVTNWGCKETLNDGTPAPRGYPGWTGRFDYIVQSHKGQLFSYPGSSDMWEGTRIHSGTGGGGGHHDQKTNFLQSFGFDFRLFADDWPAMKDAYEKAVTWAALKGDRRNIDEIVNELYPAKDLVFG